MLWGVKCRVCDGTGLVCENHPEELTPWGDASDREDACACGAGAPCPNCDPTNADPAVVRAYVAEVVAAERVGMIDLAAIPATVPNQYTELFAAEGVEVIRSADARRGREQRGEDPEREAEGDKVDAADRHASGGHQEADEPSEQQ